jgi:putative sigma-54 modulation protein
LKYKTKWLSKKRKAAKKFDGQSLEENVEEVLGLADSATVSVMVHKFPSVAKTTEVHLVRSVDSVALRPMTLEEAIKEAHFRDRDVFIFRDPKGTLMVLHRRRDGKMELIEAP